MPSTDPSPTPRRLAAAAAKGSSQTSALDLHLAARDFADRICLVEVAGRGGDTKLWPSLRFESFPQLQNAVADDLKDHCDAAELASLLYKLCAQPYKLNIDVCGNIAYLFGRGGWKRALVPLMGSSRVDNFISNIQYLRCKQEYKGDARWVAACDFALKRLAESVSDESDSESDDVTTLSVGHQQTAASNHMLTPLKGEGSVHRTHSLAPDDEKPKHVEKNARERKSGREDDERRRAYSKQGANKGLDRSAMRALAASDDQSVDMLSRQDGGWESSPAPLGSGSSSAAFSTEAGADIEPESHNAHAEAQENRKACSASNEQARASRVDIADGEAKSTHSAKAEFQNEIIDLTGSDSEEDARMSPTDFDVDSANKISDKVTKIPAKVDMNSLNESSVDHARPLANANAASPAPIGKTSKPSKCPLPRAINAITGGNHKNEKYMAKVDNNKSRQDYREGDSSNDDEDLFGSEDEVDATNIPNSDNEDLFPLSDDEEGEDSSDLEEPPNPSSNSSDEDPFPSSDDDIEEGRNVVSGNAPYLTKNINQYGNDKAMTSSNHLDTNVSSSRAQTVREEVGYVILKGQEILIPTEDVQAALVPQAWHDVDLCLTPSSSDTDEDSEAHTHTTHEGSLFLRMEASTNNATNPSWRSAVDIAPFTGLVKEIAKANGRRSDASLLAGLAVEINQQADRYQRKDLHLQSLRMERFQVKFWEVEEELKKVDGEEQLARMRGSMLLTFSLPVPGVKKEHAQSDDTTHLSSALKLLGSIIRSDWGYLHSTMEQRIDASQRTGQAFFADSLTVEEVYKRIGGSDLWLAIQTGEAVDSSQGDTIRPEKVVSNSQRGTLRTRTAANNSQGDTLRHGEAFDNAQKKIPSAQLGNMNYYTPGDNNKQGSATVAANDNAGAEPDPDEALSNVHATSSTDEKGNGNEAARQQQNGNEEKDAALRMMMVFQEEEDNQNCATGDSDIGDTNLDPNSNIQGGTLLAFPDLPKDVITEICKNLLAIDLHYLRQAYYGNRKIHHSLRTVVPGLRTKKLYRHQVRSVEWMEMRERRRITEEDLISQGGSSGEHCFHTEEEAVSWGDRHRAVTGGKTVLLIPRPRTHNVYQVDHEGHRFDLQSGALTSVLPGSRVERKTRCARGGIFCDDPGLGKTITVISLILRSVGIPSPDYDDTQTVDYNTLFYSYWHLTLPEDPLHQRSGQKQLLELITQLTDGSPEWFVQQLGDIRNKYDYADCRDFKQFEDDIRSCFENAITYCSPQHDMHQAAVGLAKKFDELLIKFKRGQIMNAIRSVKRMDKDESSRYLVDIIETWKEAEFKKYLVVSSSTLLVVPNTLLQHWEEQLIQNIDFDYISSSDSPIIYYHTSNRSLEITDARVSTDLSVIANPVLFIDDDSNGLKKLPSPDVLARFLIVLTSHRRFSSEYQHGSLEEEIKASKRGKVDKTKASSLLKVSWIRVVVDEGHKMAKNPDNMIIFNSWLTAERRWAMTGTPTKKVAASTDFDRLTELLHLVNFVKHDFFNERRGRGKVWRKLIREGWKNGSLHSFFNLKHLLSFIMIRHTKADVQILPPLYTDVSIDLSPREVREYNTLVSGIRSNIIATTMEGKTSSWETSVLNPANKVAVKMATEGLRNLRVSCCGSPPFQVLVPEPEWAQCLRTLRETHGIEDVKLEIVKEFICRFQNSGLSRCHNCGIKLRILAIMPCGHLVCHECMDNKRTTCPVPLCSKQFDADEFRRLQPGYIIEFVNREANNIRRIGWQPMPRRKGESCVYSPQFQDGRCNICGEEHYLCNFMNEDKKCSVCFKNAEECPEYASKAKYVIEKLLRIHFEAPPAEDSSNDKKRRLKAIVFYQDDLLSSYFQDRLVRRFGRACIARYHTTKTWYEQTRKFHRSGELQKFINQPECFVMLLSKDGAVGLDLSFVTHIIFIDELYDKSLEEQVVARAYRMGATDSVDVEHLRAKDSIEEVMKKMNDGHEVPLDHQFTPKKELSKDHMLLLSARFIRWRQDHNVKKRKYAGESGDYSGRIQCQCQEC